MGRIAAISATGLAVFVIAGCTGSGGTNAGAGPTAPPKVVSVSPASGSTHVNGADRVTVTYTQPLPAGDELPRLTPAIAGTWQRIGDKAIFTPRAGFPAQTRVTVTIPGGRAIPGASAAGTKARTTSMTVTKVTFTTGSYSRLRLQQLLAQLGYLPLTWSPTTVTATSPRQELSAAYDPPAGLFSWEGGYPGQLRSFWSQGKPNTLTVGAVMGFEADHGLTPDGDASTTVWNDLLKAATASKFNPNGYSYAVVTQTIPESITIWHNGKKALQSVTNTGIPGQPTPVGTFPVYEKLPFQIMSGTNPGGSHYADPVQWVSYFSGGAAVHYFVRGSYGWPQSLGCVELPYDAAKQSYPLLPYGTLVTVKPE
jgi:lipoprotein-anchoring transpeptidase ErfK/SrfK